MDESEAISHLVTQFPYKSEAYLRLKFRNCNGNMSATIDTINKDLFGKKDGSGNFFGSIFSRLRKLCNCTKRQSLPTATLHDQNPETNTRNSEEIVEINIGEEFARNSSLNLPTSFEPITEIPAPLGRAGFARNSSLNLPTSFEPINEIPAPLGTAYVDSILRQQEARYKILADLIKEDEEFGRQLQEEELKANKAGAVALTLKEPRRDSKRKNKKELPKVHQVYDISDYRDLFYGKQTAEKPFEIATTNSVEDEDFARQLQEEEFKSNEARAVPLTLKEPTRDIKRRNIKELPKVHQVYDISDYRDLFYGKQTAEKVFQIAATDSVDENDWGVEFFQQPATVYRQQAQEHLMKRKQFYTKAKQFQKERNRGLASYYILLAKKETRLYEEANNFAAAAFLAKNRERNPSKDTIDLHHLFVKEAIQALDIFLDEQILSLENGMCETKSLKVITGRGKHSADGIPKIKPAVMERLRLRSLKYSQMNPGLLKVHISKYSSLTNDLELI